MDLTTLKGIARARWWVLAMAAVLAVTIAGRLTEYRNENLPEYEALTSVTFTEDPQSSGDRGDFESYLEGQFLLAEDTNSSLLNDTPGAFIPWLLAEIDLETDENAIHFIGRGFTQAEADQMAVAMRDSFMAVSTIGAGQERMIKEMEELTVQIGVVQTSIANALAEQTQNQAQIQAQIDTAALLAEQPKPLTEQERADQVLRAALESRIDALRSSYAGLGVDLTNPIFARRTATIQTQMDQVFEELMRISEELATVPVVRTVIPTTISIQQQQIVDQARRLDELRLAQMESRWQQLFTGLRELAALTSVIAPSVEQTSLDPTSPGNAQALALVGALIAVMVGLVAVEKGRGILWSESDLEDGPPILGELPPRPLWGSDQSSDQAWYLTSPGGRRKVAIQKLRSQMDYQENAVIAFQGSGVLRDDTQELTVDVAVAVAVSDRSVLVIDTWFRNKVGLAEFGSQYFGETLTELLKIDLEDRQIAMAEYKLALLNRPEAARGLRIVRAGQGIGNAADALAGERFELLIEVARGLFDMVLVSGGPVSDPDSHVLAQRVDSAILVGSAGHTAVSRVETAAREFAGFRANLLGMVLIRRRRGRLGRWAHSTSRRRLKTSRGRLKKLASKAWQGVKKAKVWQSVKTAKVWQSVKTAKVWQRIKRSWAASAPSDEDD